MQGIKAKQAFTHEAAIRKTRRTYLLPITFGHDKTAQHQKETDATRAASLKNPYMMTENHHGKHKTEGL